MNLKNCSLPTVATVITSAFFIWFGLTGVDLTDQGYLLGNPDAWKEPWFLPIWGSAAFANVSLYLFGDYSLAFTKLFAFFQSFIILGLFLKVTGIFERKNYYLMSLLVLICLWASRSPLNEWSYYTTLSGLAVSLGILSYYSCLTNRRMWLFSLGNVFVLVSIAIKFTNIVFLPLPLFFSYYYLQSGSKEDQKKLILFYVGSIIALVMMIAVAYSIQDVRNYFIDGFEIFRKFMEATKLHSPGNLFQKTIDNFKSYTVTSIIFCFYLFALYQIQKRNGSLWWSVLVSAIFFGLNSYHIFYRYNGLFVFYMMGLIYIGVKSEKRLRFFCFATLYFLLINSAGSSNALRAAFIAEPLSCFIIIHYCYEHFKEYKKILTFGVLFLTIVAVYSKVTFLYRDLPRLSLTTTSEIPRLSFLFSNNEKIKVIESIFSSTRNYAPEAQSAIIYPSAPLLHYVLKIKPWTPNPWVNLYFANILKEIAESKSALPDVIIRLHQNPRLDEWPANLKPISEDKNIETILFIDRFVEIQNYELKESNKHFSLYVRKTL